MSQTRPEVSVVVPVYNQAEQLRRLLDSFSALERGKAVEVIIVDDCSTDDTPQAAAAWRESAQDGLHSVRALRHERNAGPGRARNTGLAEASAPVVLFTDSDCVVAPDWCWRLAQALDPARDIGGAGGHTVPLSEASVFARYNTANQTLLPSHGLQYLVTCNCAYLRDPLRECGGFDETIPAPGGEDVAASIRMWKAGWRFAYVPDAMVRHDYDDTLSKFMRTFYNYGYGCCIVAHRYLTDSERKPENLQFFENYWNWYPIKPKVGGLRSLAADQANFWRNCRARGMSLREILPCAAVRVLDQAAYLRGWKAALAHLRAVQAAEGARSGAQDENGGGE